jgi:hypothetical protein
MSVKGAAVPESTIAKMKRALFEEVIATVSAGFDGLWGLRSNGTKTYVSVYHHSLLSAF